MQLIQPPSCEPDVTHGCWAQKTIGSITNDLGVLLYASLVTIGSRLMVRSMAVAAKIEWSK